MRRALVRAALVVYSLIIFLALDFVLSAVAPELVMPNPPDRRSPRIANPIYDHALAPRFDGTEYWGEATYRLRTNSLGFRDASTREVSAKASTRRVLLMGDSFTEGIGVAFEDTFAGLLFQAGQGRAEPIEFLNGALSSYSPTIYYRKIKYLIESGVQFDEVVVFSDLSDVQDEAVNYFCIDEHPEYRANCRPDRPDNVWSRKTPNYWQTHFILSDTLRVLVKKAVQRALGNQKSIAVAPIDRVAWVIPGYDGGATYGPLGIQGGITRSLRNMQDLADLLASHRIPLTIAVYPWPAQLEMDDRDSRQVSLWRDFCLTRCKTFINLYPAVFAAKDAHPDWYDRYFIFGDFHYSAEGHKLLFDALAKTLLPERPTAPAAAAPLEGSGSAAMR